MKFQKTIFLLLALVLIISACAGAVETPDATAIAKTASVIAESLFTETSEPLPSATSTSTFTPIPPTATLTLTPTETLTPTFTPTFTPSPTATPSGWMDPNLLLNYFFVVDTGGPVGCGDNMFPVHIGIYKTDDPAQNLRVALEKLFGNDSLTWAGLHNPIAPSNIRVDEISFNGARGHFEVYTSGTLVKTHKEYCEWTRIRIQVNTTALAAVKPYTVNISLNGKPFNDYVSGDTRPDG